MSWMLGLIQFIPNLFTTVNGITTAISNAQIAKINATTEQDKIAAQATVDTLQARRDVMIAESGGSKLNVIIRSCIGAPVAFLLCKVFVYDKALGAWTSGRTDALDPNLWNVVMAVIGFYFLYDASTTVARIVKS